MRHWSDHERDFFCINVKFESCSGSIASYAKRDHHHSNIYLRAACDYLNERQTTCQLFRLYHID